MTSCAVTSRVIESTGPNRSVAPSRAARMTAGSRPVGEDDDEPTFRVVYVVAPRMAPSAYDSHDTCPPRRAATSSVMALDRARFNGCPDVYASHGPAPVSDHWIPAGPRFGWICGCCHPIDGSDATPPDAYDFHSRPAARS